MRKLTLLIALLLLAGCAQRPVIANLNLSLGPQPSGVYGEGAAAVLSGLDARTSTDLVVYLNDRPASRLGGTEPPGELISQKLREGLEQQGLQLQANAPVRVGFSINELLVTVTRARMLYSADAKTSITLNVDNRGTVLTRVYRREASQSGATRPELAALENMLNSQISDILEQILQDEEVQAVISGR